MKECTNCGNTFGFAKYNLDSVDPGWSISTLDGVLFRCPNCEITYNEVEMNSLPEATNA